MERLRPMLQIRETFVNETKGYQFGESDWYEPYTDNRGRLFRDMQREYGRCTSSVYMDVPKTDAEHAPLPHTPLATRREYRTERVGWVFAKRMRYEDARGNDPERDYYMREVWVQVREVDES